MNNLGKPKYKAQLQAVDTIGDNIYQLRVSFPKSMKLNEKFEFLSGQFCCFGLSDKEEDLRPYSIASAPSNDYLEFHIRDTGGVFSSTVCSKDQIGTTLYFTEASGSAGYCDDPSRDVVLFAGGTGYAPLRAILETLKGNGFQRDVTLFIGGRDVDALYMRKELDGLKQSMPNLSVHYCADVVADDEMEIEQGYLSDLAQRYMQSFADKRVYIAGPPPMVLATQKYVLDHEASKDLIHLDQENIDFYLKQNKSGPNV